MSRSPGGYVAFSGIFPHLDNQRNDAKNLKRSLLYGRFIFQKSRVLDILGWPTPSGCSLHLNGTVVERQTSFTDDTGRTGRTRPDPTFWKMWGSLHGLGK
jgi:hypothetical protein